MSLPHPYPYYFYVQRPLKEFWAQYGTRNRKVLFILGAGFDPRCYQVLRSMATLFNSDAQLDTFCARFTNLKDGHLSENTIYTNECLTEIRAITKTLKATSYHIECEVGIFSEDGKLVGDELLMKEFRESCAGKLDNYTDIVVDISAFPRTLMFALLGHLWRRRRSRQLKQNLFAVLTESPVQVTIEESGHQKPTFMWGGNKLKRSNARAIWIPVLGGEVRRFEKIYESLRPKDVLPIVPFPAGNPRIGDDILLAARKPLFEKWGVPFTNVMYASGDTPFDVFRKIQDIVVNYKDFPDISVVVSALSGRSLSLGVLLAALWSNLFMYHSQPTTYKIDPKERQRLKRVCHQSRETIYWLDGEIYEDQ
jgi:hypothetical protein